MGEYKVAVTARSFGKTDNLAYECLQGGGCRVVNVCGMTREERERELRDADALIAGLEELDGAAMDASPRLRVISRYGVGYDRVDIQAARERGIAVTITPGANTDSVADLAVGLMLAAARAIPLMDASIRHGAQLRPQGVEMAGKTLGIIGAGRIGQGVARRCRGFGMRILLYDVFQDAAFAGEVQAEYTELDTLLRESDFISIHAPGREETRGLISRRELALMKPEAVLVNTARGGIVDETALSEALRAGLIRAAALDATEKEPPYDSPLMECENCILTPHAGAATREASSRMSLAAAQNVLDVLAGRDCAGRIC